VGALLQSLIAWYLQSLEAGGFPLVLLLMAVESSIFPLPSEVVIPPAAHLAWTEGIDFFGTKLAGWPGQLALVVAGAIGSWIGATVMYWFSRVAGRPIVMRFGKYVFISPHKIEGAERWADTYGAFGIFASRLLPVVRHLIGIPAGIVRMDYGIFSVYTLIGSAIWSAVLCGLGVQVGADVSKGEMHRVTIVLVVFLAGVGALYYAFVHRHMRAASKAG
jgi:membrane protein DedA with SNARE-associated domain